MVSTLRHAQFFYTTPPQPCPYLPGQVERKVIADLAVPNADALHNRLSRAGFRRSHTLAYTPVCENCSACTPIRIPVARFAPDRTQRRILRHNADLQARCLPPVTTPEQYALFRRYQTARHTEGDMATMTAEDYRSMVEDTPVETMLFEFRSDVGELLIVSLIDRLEDGLSAVYSFYDPDQPHRSLGTLAILFLIEETARLGLPYLYLGYWIQESRKMSYKSRFRPAEILRQGLWRTLEDALQSSHETRPA
ncbi:arginyltransferase [Acetobacter orleanensis]|uniref:Aspartate/glutamate leucyltransferase n=1 Tax=Acetobacter orleanensis TaxID=104099 RepID=A0A4Y3TPC8_9PROT|nr:arginyltransferase [Acetobacter orleanensis]KXV63522.1 arginyl-tRNA-protein transferase [Acetobacter orleanensis]PCD79917.1 arginyltransferase [Acetobacter orleanensis]GAN68220.1 arginyl-tRNA--protein arginylyl transferase [Acetobacter orleanensis JCM 7639]GBR31363.1 arginyl-tRNA-protein transferase [Acetobacter orleanensis NRIC 0473]GEB82887.1 putative arginyl-tRNA--protein transferase [Acetobacter orleanensis]